MTKVQHVSVAVKDDFVAKQTRARPIAALSELIWNSLDADATKVSVELEYGDLAGGLSKIVVSDDGTGFSREDAPTLFGSLGGSWKRTTRETEHGHRSIHGQEGKGRYKAFALGRSVTWHVVHGATPAERQSFQIEILGADLTDVSISEAAPAPNAPTGVTVIINDVLRDFRSFETEDGLQELAEIFALYLINYKSVVIEIAGRRVDPEAAIARQNEIALESQIVDGEKHHGFSLHVVEWKADSKKILYLCSNGGFPLDRVETKFHVSGFSFSAYLKSTYISELENEGLLGLAELDSRLVPAVDEARETIKTFFRERAAEEARSVVDTWKAEKIYPFEGDPQSTVELAERQVFDIVASQLHQLAPDLGSTSQRAQALHLRMLRNAIERGPEELQTILREVLDLPVKKQKELAALLQETTLSAIITAAKTVADRLKFIDALENIVFDEEKKQRLKERTQLHKILAENTWVFGEEYNLWVSDRGLRMVLEKHRDKLDPSICIDEPVAVYGQKVGIVDLMFSRTSRRHRANDIEHLVVELKAPKVKIGADEIVQAKKYQLAVVNDERFRTVPGLKWHFVVISNAYDEYAKGEIDGGPDPERRLVTRSSNATVTVKTWGEVIDENRARLQFFQEHLQHSADDSQALRYLQERHSALLEGVMDISSGGDPVDLEKQPEFDGAGE